MHAFLPYHTRMILIKNVFQMNHGMKQVNICVVQNFVSTNVHELDDGAWKR